jgi:hypothetical protein
MNSTEFYAEFAKIVNEAGRVFDGTERLEDILAWDSVAVMEFIAFCDERFGRTLKGKRITACQVTGELWELATGAAVGD